MRLVFLYLRKRDFPVGRAVSDGYHAMIRKFVELGLVDRADFIMDCYAYPESSEKIGGVTTSSIQNFFTKIQLEPTDVLFVRGGWKPWIPWIEEQRRKGCWTIFYGAGTGHGSWPYWDVVVDDCVTDVVWSRRTGAVIIPFRKAVSEEFDYADVERPYDLCLGANYVYDRKGQYIAYAAAERFQELFGRTPTMVMPGALRGHEQTIRMIKKIIDRKDVDLPGHVSRGDLVPIMQRSKIFVHLGTSTQGDRGSAEAGRCGCRILLGHRRHHAPYLFSAPGSAVPTVEGDLSEIARLYSQGIAADEPGARQATSAYFKANDGFSQTGLAVWRDLFGFIRGHPTRDTEALQGRYHV